MIDLLKSLSVEPEAICREVEKRHGPSSDPVVPGQLPFSPWAKNALLLAAKEAGSDGWIHSGHLLLGLLLESRGIAGQVLRDLELDPAELRKRY